jgi:hypothetical protein
MLNAGSDVCFQELRAMIQFTQACDTVAVKLAGVSPRWSDAGTVTPEPVHRDACGLRVEPLIDG